MSSSFGNGLNRFQACQKLFIKFTEACYGFHTTSLYGSIMFTKRVEVRNKLNPLASDFNQKMIKEGERPWGGTLMFTAMKRAAEMLLTANCIDEETGKRKYPNAEMRENVISDGYDGCSSYEMTEVSNFLLENHIRIDAIIVANQIAKELVAISRFSGGIAFYPRNIIY